MYIFDGVGGWKTNFDPHKEKVLHATTCYLYLILNILFLVIIYSIQIKKIKF